MIEQKRYINEHGQVISEGSRTFKVFDDEKGYLFRSKNYFVKSYSDIKLSEFLNNKSDFTNISLLSETIYKDTNMIAVTERNISRPASMEDISKIIGLCDRRAKQFIDRMTQKGVLAKATVNTQETITVQFYISPLFFMSNKYLSPFLFMLFREQLKPYLKPWAWKTLNDAANLKDVGLKIVPAPAETVENPLKKKVEEMFHSKQE